MWGVLPTMSHTTDQKLLITQISSGVGFHAVAQLYSRMPEVISDLEHVHETVVDALEGNAKIMNIVLIPGDDGVSMFVALTSGHLIIHTHPQKRFAVIDLLVAMPLVDPLAVIRSISEKLI